MANTGIAPNELNKFANDSNVDSAGMVADFFDALSDPLLTEAQKYELLGEQFNQQFQDYALKAQDWAARADLADNPDAAQLWNKIANQFDQAALDHASQGTDAWVKSLLTGFVGDLSKVLGDAGNLIDPLQMSAALLSGDYSRLGEISTGLFFGTLVAASIPLSANVFIAGALVWGATELGEALWRAYGPSVSEEVSAWFTGAQIWTPLKDPLTLDLDGDGLEVLPNDGSILFDHDADGNQAATSWIAPDDGLLVRDLDGNGAIDTGRELFGDNTIKSDGTHALDGFDALADLDSNGDGVVSSADQVFNELRIWQDLNSDGISQANELTGLASRGIASISLSSNPHSKILPDGSRIADLGTFNYVDGRDGAFGQTGQLGDVDLRENSFFSSFADAVPLTPEARSLPNMRGSGQVRDLSEAVSLSAGLAAILADYAAATTRDAQRALLDDLLLAWSDTSTMQTTATGAYAGHDVTIGFGDSAPAAVVGGGGAGSEHEAWLNKLTVLERFNGRTFWQVPDGSGPVSLRFTDAQLLRLDESYTALMESVYGALIIQTRLSEYVNSIGLIPSADGSAVEKDATGLDALLEAKQQTDPINAYTDLIELIKYSGGELATEGWQGIQLLRTWLADPTVYPGLDAVASSLGLRRESGTITSGAFQGIMVSDIILSGDQPDFISVGGNDDIVDSSLGADFIFGGAGGDYLLGGGGDDLIYGDGHIYPANYQGPDNPNWNIDVTWGADGEVNILFSGVSGWETSIADDIDAPADGRDVLFGGMGRDVLLGGGEADYLSGDEDTDMLEGGSGDDVLNGGLGDDWLIGDDNENLSLTGNDSLSGGAGLDHLTGGPGDDTLHGGADADSLIGDVLDNDAISGADSLYGEGGDDELIGGPGDDYLDGGLDADTLFGDQDDQNPAIRGNDTLMGGAGNDDLTGGAGNDQLFGGDDNDTLYGDLLLDDPTAHGDDYLDGGAGVDTLLGDGGNDYIRGGDGNDYIEGDRTGLGVALHGADTLYGDAGADLIFGNGGNDLIYGGTENDELQGNQGDDVLYGEDGDDRLFGQEDNDTLYGGAGLDSVWGGTGNDLILGEAGNDILNGEDGDDDIEGGDGDDTLDGGAGHDRLVGGAGSDTLYGGYGNDILLGGDAVDILRGGDGDDLLDGGDGDEIYLQGGAGADTIYGGAGNDTLQGEAGDDILDGGTGTDLLSGGTGDDQFRFGRGYGADTVFVNDANPAKRDAVVLASDILTTDVVLKRGTGTGNLDNLIISIAGTTDTLTLPYYFSQDGESANRVEEIRFADGTVWDVATVKAMITQGTAGNDTLTGFSGADSLFGYGGTDTLWARAGNDYLDGGPGTDTLRGEEGDDVLYGGTGNDTLYGASGNDTYRFGSGDGNDAIYNGDASVGRLDVVEFMGGLTPAAISATRTGNNLVLRIVATGEALTVNGYFSQDGASDGSVDEIRFADGTVWDIAAVKTIVTQGTASGDTLYGYATDDVLSGLSGDDTLRGGLGNDTLDGGPGTDTLYGEQGDDIYLFGRGDGVDTVRNATNSLATDIDAVWFKEDVNPEGISLQRSYVSTSDDDLQLSIIGTSDRLILDNYFTATSPGLVDRIEFVDGTVWTEAYIRARLVAGTELPDNLRGYATADTIDGLAGDDTLRGEAGTDHLFGGAGADTIYGGADGDDIHGGAGDDHNLNGEAGNDQLFGEAGDDKLFGGADADALDGGIGNDRLEGGAGNDTYYFYRGAGADVLWELREENGGGTDTVRLTGGILPDAVSLHRDGDNLIIALDQSATQLAVGNFFFHESHPNNTFQIERIEFDNGVVWDLAGINQRVIGGAENTISGGPGDDLLVVDHQADVVSEAPGGGVDTVEASVTYTLPENVENLTLAGYVNINGTGNTLSNTLTGNSGNNVLDGGSWETDLLIGGPGDDTFNVDNDTVVEAEGEGIDLVVLKSSNWYVLPENVENLRNESNSGARATLYGNQADNWIVSRAVSNDIVYGQGGDDTLIGGSSSNVLYGDADNDTLSGLNGNDELYGGTGDDVLDGGSGSDRLEGGGGDDVYVNVDAADTLVELPDEGIDTVQTNISFTLEALGDFENLTLKGLGAINGTGNSADNVLTGNAAANTLVGGEGADALVGAAGNDVLDGGNGDDTYVLNSGDGSDFISDGSGVDSIVYGPGIAFGDIRPLLANGQLYLSSRNEPGEGVIIGAWGSSPVIESFVFEDVGQVSADVLLAPRWSTWFDAEMEQWNVTVVTASGYVLTTAGGSAAGEISGSTDDDLLVVTGYVLAGEGNDVVYGQNGNDRLDGGAGADRLAGGRGDDVYYVDNPGDVVSEGVDAGTDTVNSSISYALTADVENLTLTGADAIDGAGNALSNTLTGNEAANVLNGEAGDDTLRGMAGDDILNGGDGNDLLETGYGFDYAYGGAGNDTITGGNNVPGGWLPEYLYGEEGDDLLIGGGKYAHLYGGAGNDELRGGAGYQNLYGEDGDDLLIAGALGYMLDGGAGADRMVGSANNNTYSVDNILDVIAELPGGGTDTVNSSISYVLNDNLENLILVGTGAISGTGNSGNNTLNGSLNAAANTLAGGLGDDTYVIGAGDVIVEQAGEGIDSVNVASSYTLGDNLENLTLTSSMADNGTGNALDNRLVGNGYNNALSGLGGNDYLSGGYGNDTLNGGAGIDEMLGGYGNDIYYVDNSGDLVTELAGQGTDTVYSSISYTLGSNVERLTLTGAAVISAIGNTLANILTGNGSSNLLIGDAGNDTLRGMGGNDWLPGGAGNDVIEGGDGADILFGSLGNDTVAGGWGSDQYTFARGDGQDVVNDYDARDADPATYGQTTDAVQFGADIAHDQLWFTRLGNDLQVQVIGTSDRVAVQNWYLGSAYQVEALHAGDGYTLLNTQVEQLVQAMASFAPPASGELSLSAGYRQELEPVIAANWQSAA